MIKVFVAKGITEFDAFRILLYEEKYYKNLSEEVGEIYISPYNKVDILIEYRRVDNTDYFFRGMVYSPFENYRNGRVNKEYYEEVFRERERLSKKFEIVRME